MSTTNPSLDGLRIDRRSAASPPRGWWIVMLLIGAACLGGAFWWSRGSFAIAVKTEPARAMVSGGQKTLLNASGYVTARRAAIR